MRIAIHDYAGFAFPFDLSCELSKRGNNVLHLFTKASGGPKAEFDKTGFENLEIYNINFDLIDKDNFIKRWIQEIRYGDLALKKLEKWKPDIVISGNTPLVTQKKIMTWTVKNKVPAVFWLQDLLSLAAKSIISNVSRLVGSFAYSYLNKIEIDTLSKANHIIAITEDFIPFLKQWNINPVKVSIIPNWGPIEQIPVLSRKNRFSDEYGLNEKFVILYSGTLGKKQDIKLIADTAAKLVDDNEIIFVIATDERGQNLIKQQLNGKNLPNLIKLPLQPSHLYPYLLASSDVSLVALEASASMYCVPSKIWSTYCAQKPSIIAVDKRNLCARITEDICAGFVVQPGSVDECITAIRKLKKNKSLRVNMGKNARRYAEQYFPISKIADEFETIIHHIVLN